MSKVQQLQLKGIQKSYNRIPVLEDIHLQVFSGDIYTLIGKNGAGKTTLLEILVGLNGADQGEIYYNHQQIQTSSLQWKRRIGVALNIDHLIQTLTVEEYLTLLGGIYGLDKATTASRSNSLIQFFYEPEEKIAKPIQSYSSGMKKKALICAALIHNPEIILLDEPFTFLDPAACSRLCDFLCQQRQAGKIILLSSHDLLYIDKIATRIGVLNDHKLIMDSDYETFKEENDFFKDNKMLKKILNYDNKNLTVLEGILK